MNSEVNKKINPLAQYFRQPKIYLKLPSKGNFYPQSTLDKSETGEYPVYSMNAKDELMLKTPDALLNGQSTVDVIKSCIPSIQDPWKMPSIDIDASLVAIRIATYGENMDVATNCPHCNEDNTYSINLVKYLENLAEFQFDNTVKIDPLIVYVRPYQYKEMTETALKTLEYQKIFQTINSDELSDEEKLDKFGKSFSKLTALTVDIIAKCIEKISSPDGDCTDQEQIREFLHNAPKEIFNKINDHVQELKRKIDFPPQTVSCNSCTKEFLMPISMDQSNFFAVRS